MARPLTKTTPDGAAYTRPAQIEAQIDEALHFTLPELRNRLLVTDQTAPAYLSHECLVHLIRQGRRSGDQALMSAVLPVLLGRCEANLLVKVPDRNMVDTVSLRQEILDTLTDLFAVDGSENDLNELDFYECRFNKAFRALRIDAVRRQSRRNRSVDVIDLPREEAMGGPDAYEDALAKLSDVFRVLPTQEWHALREPLLTALEDLSPDDRKAVILVHVLGYKEESTNPDEETAATRCNCTGRTIRNRLARAAVKLSHLKENL